MTPAQATPADREAVEVTQADRSLYAAMCEESGRFIGFARDSHPHLQLLARYRLAATARQDARIAELEAALREIGSWAKEDGGSINASRLDELLALTKDLRR